MRQQLRTIVALLVVIFALLPAMARRTGSTTRAVAGGCTGFEIVV